jgi:hypothetical protein
VAAISPGVLSVGAPGTDMVGVGVLRVNASDVGVLG